MYDKMNVISLVSLAFLLITLSFCCIAPIYFVVSLCSAGVGIFAQIKAFQLKK